MTRTRIHYWIAEQEAVLAILANQNLSTISKKEGKS